MLSIDEADVIAMDSARSALNSEHHQLNNDEKQAKPIMGPNTER